MNFFQNYFFKVYSMMQEMKGIEANVMNPFNTKIEQ